MELNSSHLRLGLIASALIVSLSIGYYVVVVVPAERRAVELRLASEQHFRREIECREQYDKMRRQFNNVVGVSYFDLLNTCMVTYKDENGVEQKVPMAGLLRVDSPAEQSR